MDIKKCHSVILAALLVAGTGACSKTPEEVKAEKAKVEAQTTGRLAVKSNRANTTIEATLIPAAGEAASAPHSGVPEGAAEQAMGALPPGKYSLTSRSEGWPEIRQEVNITAGRATEVAINFKSGSLRLDSVPTGATVKLGSGVLGKTPLLIPQLPPGSASLALEYPSWPAVTVKVAITENVEATETVRLPHGKLVVESFPSGATILMGGKAIGQTPLTLERVPAGAKKLTLQAKDFPTLELAFTVEDKGEVRLNQEMGAGLPVLDPAVLMRGVWVVDNPDKLAPQFDTAGPYQPQNGVVKNLHRKRLYENWLRRSYRLSGTIKAYDAASGQVELVEQASELSKYRVLAKLAPDALMDKDLAARLVKGATLNFYGRLTAVEEPRWPAKIITFELSAVEPLR